MADSSNKIDIILVLFKTGRIIKQKKIVL